MGRRWMPVAVTAGVAALLAVAAVVTVNHAGCADPGSYVRVPGGVQLVGGCLNGADLPVAPAPLPSRLPAHPKPPSGA
ncbi:MAG TPA: hypothetical protein VFO16_12535 [Pseudonocardiaceae bacterium]|nr:hypothetical protein [Pseudonocardiaceae bacterium]